ncbi:MULTISPECIES: ABC transporter ATP-binding protein [Halorussus]|uniref:ABC transporter ATP-binding protein n=1 Tax=Halorussus TaxID=1070314 RepID=UPI0020A085C6|nr:ABC transporter ATP-binding protein [Halorussus vallis]USZ78378.1 ABC transporter ATP-binding protein [Halorussus vallis]
MTDVGTSQFEDRASIAKEEEDVILKAEDATVWFDMSRGQSTVLNHADLEIRRNEIIGVVGESGSGKSMFAAALLDVVENPGSLSGEVTYYPQSEEQLPRGIATDENGAVNVLELNDELQRRFRWEEAAMVFQGAMSSFNPTMKIGDHFKETIRAHNADLNAQMAHARDILEALHLDPNRVFGSYPHELSGGMKQRALIALALTLEPRVLVMDEPTAALDMLMQRSIIAMLRELQEQFDLTILFITHDLPLMAGLADRLAVMYAFEFAEIGSAEKILKNAAHPYTRALLRSLPSIDSVVEEMRPIEGSAPDPVNTPSGCRYHPRCPLADEQCETVDPEIEEVEREQAAACFYTEESREAIDYTLHAGVTEEDTI